MFFWRLLFVVHWLLGKVVRYVCVSLVVCGLFLWLVAVSGLLLVVCCLMFAVRCEWCCYYFCYLAVSYALFADLLLVVRCLLLVVH